MDTSFRLNDELEVISLGGFEDGDIDWISEDGLKVGDRVTVSYIELDMDIAEEFMQVMPSTNQLYQSVQHFKLVEKMSDDR